MAVTVLESIESRPVAVNSGEWTGSRSFHVWDASTPITTPAGVAVYFGTNGLPYYRDPFPDVAITLLATNPSISRLPGHTDTWLVTWQYTESGSLSPQQQKEPNDIGYVEISGGVHGEFVDSWRAVPSSQLQFLVKEGGSYPFGTPTPLQSDIGGAKIDVAGVPVSTLVRMAEVSFGITLEAPPNLGYYGQFVGRRNSGPFNGAAKGRVLYIGASVNRTSQRKWSVTHKFIADEACHMRQAPFLYPDGSPALAPSPIASSHAAYVYYVQPYPDLVNFYALSPYLTGVV